MNVKLWWYKHFNPQKYQQIMEEYQRMYQSLQNIQQKLMEFHTQREEMVNKQIQECMEAIKKNDPNANSDVYIRFLANGYIKLNSEEVLREMEHCKTALEAYRKAIESEVEKRRYKHERK